MRALIIKLTSMGDLMHALPALTDAAAAIPGIEFDWVGDKNFSAVPLWHPAVKNVITTAHRQWKKALSGLGERVFSKTLNNSLTKAITISLSTYKTI